MLISRIEKFDWNEISEDLLGRGFAVTDRLLFDDEIEALKASYEQEDLYRKTIVMQRYSMGRGEYKYYRYPLPDLVQDLRKSFYAKLFPLANEWSSRLGLENRYPQTHEDFLSECLAASQSVPTPLILHYSKGDYNCLHQDLYGKVWFPFQVIFGLSDETEYQGGELVLTKQRPRLQSIPYVMKIPKGAAVITTTNFHAEKGMRGFY
ncbi:MAG: hypothetical protein EOP10_28660, partial [Proteobacteria bacterium]